MIFSFTRCSQDFLETSDESENFAREARLYFEQNASGIQNVSIGDQRTVLSRSMNLSSAVIVPRWEKQEYFKNEYFSILEVPLDGNVYVKSNYTTKTSNKNTTLLSSNVLMKLIIRKDNKTDELEYFVATIIDQQQRVSLSSNAPQPSSSGYFQHPDNGLIIISSVEGNYIGAFMYNDRVRKGVRLARTSGEEGKIASENIIGSFNLMNSDASSLFSRSGESGGGGTVYCALCGKANCDGNCEVLVTYCNICHKPLDQCTGHYDPPIKVCPKCGKAGCSGNCQTTGGGIGGDQGAQSIPPTVKKLCDMTGTNLTSQQLTNFEGALKKFQEKYPKIKEMFDAISKLENKPKVYLSSEETKGNVGRYDEKTNTIYYRDGTALVSDGGLEEFIHAAQYQICYPNENPGSRNIEFEAKMFYDLNCVMAGDLPSWSTRGLSTNAQLIHAYFMETFKSSQHLTPDLLEQYHELGRQWNAPDYPKGIYNDTIDPKLIQTFFK